MNLGRLAAVGMMALATSGEDPVAEYIARERAKLPRTDRKTEADLAALAKAEEKRRRRAEKRRKP